MANPRILTKNSQFRAVSTAPSINKTPMGNSTPPVPYPVTHDLSNSQGVVDKYKLNGDPVYVFDQSTQPKCIGDNPGRAGGVKSGTVNGEIKPTSSSGHQKVMGKKVVRAGDTCTLNKGNCPGVYVSAVPPASGTAATSPPIKPETPEEKGFMGKAADLYKKLDVKALRNLKDGINKGIDGMVESSGYNPVVMAIGAVAVAANEVIVPENVTDFTPAKLLKVGAKGVKAAKGLSNAENVVTAAAKAEGKQAVKAAAKTGGSGNGFSHKGKGKFYRSKSERRKALKRDAEDPNSTLTKEQRDYIKDHDGNNVPKDCEVSHNKPLELGKTIDEKRALDKAENMTTMQKPDHRALHRQCGDTYHMVKAIKGK